MTLICCMPISASPFATISATGTPSTSLILSFSCSAIPSRSISFAAMMPLAPVEYDRLGYEHRVLEGLGRADVGLRRSRLDRDADAGSGEINAAVHHLALLDEIVDHVGIVRDQIRPARR